MAEYYVDATGGDDGNDGLSEENAWQTISKVNGETFSAGDHIYFKRGETWREVLTPPSSGSDGSPIVFGAYGSGANPILSGGDVVSTWTQVTASEESGGLFVSGFETASFADWDSVTSTARHSVEISSSGPDPDGGSTCLLYTFTDTAGGGGGLETVFPPAGGTDTHVRFRLRVSSGAFSGDPNWRLFWLTDGGGTAGMQFKITANGDGSTIGINAAGNNPFFSIVDDNDCLSYDTWHTVEVHFVRDASVGGAEIFVDGVSIGSSFANDTSALFLDDIRFQFDRESANINDGATVRLDNFKVDESSIGDVSIGDVAGTYEATLATQPYVVSVDGTIWREGSGFDSLSDHEWFWDSNILYVRDDSGDPDVTGVEVVAGQRTRCIHMIGVDWTVVETLTLEDGNERALHWDTNATNNILRDGTIRRMGDASMNGAINGNDGSNDCTISNVTFEDLYGGKGILAWNCSGWTVTGCTMDGAAKELRENFCHLTGDSTHHADYVVTNNTVDCTPTWATGLCDKHVFNLADYGGAGSSTGGLVRGNIVNGGGAHHGGYEIRNSGTAGTRLIVEKNIAHNFRNGPGQGNGFTVRPEWDTEYVTFRYNLAFNVDVGFNTWDSGGDNDRSNFLFYNNTVHGARIGVAFNSPMSGEFKNNTLWDCTERAFQWTAGEVAAENFEVEYNDLGPEAANFLEHTAATYSTLAAWETAVPEAANNITSDPLFVNAGGTEATDYKLTADSPCVDAGTDVSLTEDYFGLTVGSSPDIGFAEFPGVGAGMSTYRQGVLRGGYYSGYRDAHLYR